MSWSPGAENVNGYREDEIRGKHYSVFYPPEEVAAGAPARSLEMATRQGRYQVEGWRVRKDGTRFWADVVVTAVRDSDGHLVGFVKVTRDLTDRLHAENERIHLAQERMAREMAEEGVRLRDEFLGVAAHELKTPVTSLRMYTQLMARHLARDGKLDPEATRRALDVVDQQTHKLTDLVNKLLDFSRVANGRLALDLEQTDVVSAVSEVVEHFRTVAPKGGIAFDAPTSLMARVDPLRLEQVVANLLDNALKYGGDGPIEVAVSSPNPNQTQISVRDHGPGIPEEKREFLFERFYQANSRYSQVGLGLGLYISRQIVEQHGGQITVNFPPDGGTRFTITLPVSPPLSTP